MLRKREVIPVVIFCILATPIFASADLIEENVGDYNYTSTRTSYWSLVISGRNVSYPVHNLRYDGGDQHSYVQVIEFDNDTFSKDYLSFWISDKISENQSLVYNGYYLFKHYRTQNNLVWRHKNFYVQVGGSNDDYSNLPNELLDAYLEIYPSECSKKECPNLDKPIEERVYNTFFLGFNERTYGLFFKHNGFYIRCKNIVKYGREGAVDYPNLDYEGFKGQINQYLSDSMYFSEDELTQLYVRCMEEEEIRIEGLPLDGFLKYCYDKVSTSFVEDDEEDKSNERILMLCDKTDLMIIENNEYFEELKREEGDDVINRIIDFIVQKDLEKIEQEKQDCINWKEGDEPIAGCDSYTEDEGDEGSIIALKPCTEEVLEEGLDCIPVEEGEVEEPIEEYLPEEEAVEEAQEGIIEETINEKQEEPAEGVHDELTGEPKEPLEETQDEIVEEPKIKLQSILVKIVSFLKRLFW